MLVDARGGLESGDLDSADHEDQARVIAATASASDGCDGAIVDTALMTADPMDVIAAFHVLGLPVLAVANHDDVALRKRALAVGAGKVLAYRKLHDDGPATIAAWVQSTQTQADGVTSR